MSAGCSANGAAASILVGADQVRPPSARAIAGASMSGIGSTTAIHLVRGMQL